MNQAEVHTTNTSPAEAEIRVERFLGHLFLYMYLHGCAYLCAQRKKKRKVTLQQKLVLRKRGNSSFKLQQPCKNCSGSTNDVHRSDINRSQSTFLWIIRVFFENTKEVHWHLESLHEKEIKFIASFSRYTRVFVKSSYFSS